MSATDSASTVLAPGTQVPDFKLATEGGEEFTQGDLQGKTTVFVFYPFAFSPVCTDQLQVYEQSLAEITAQGADIYGVSCDSSWSQKAFREKLGMSISAAVGLRAQGRGLRSLRGASPRWLPSARACDRRRRRRRALELSGTFTGRPSARTHDPWRTEERLASAKLHTFGYKDKRKRLRRPTGGEGR